MPELSIRTRGVPHNRALRDYIERRIRFATDRFTTRLARIRVQVGDANGPRGGVDKVCVISADLVPDGRILIEERQPGLLIAVYRATRRLALAVARHKSRSDQLSVSTIWSNARM